jgi:hypothetical protein
MTTDQANAALPQRHCRDTEDHPAHEWITRDRYCPGRHTGHGFVTNQPIAHPMDLDPFAGLND